MLDLHCHILPGVDDGSPDWETSLAMARLLVDSGFTQVAPSPHYGEGPGGDVPIAVADSLRSELREKLRVEGIDLEILPNAEHFVSPRLFERIEQDSVVTIGGEGKWLLVELPWQSIPESESVLFRLQMKGFRLVLAHPERYQYVEPDMVERLVQRGVKMQLVDLCRRGTKRHRFNDRLRHAADGLFG